MDARRRFRGEHSPRFANPQLAAHYLADGADTLPTMGVMRQVERMRYDRVKPFAGLRHHPLFDVSSDEYCRPRGSD